RPQQTGAVDRRPTGRTGHEVVRRREQHERYPAEQANLECAQRDEIRLGRRNQAVLQPEAAHRRDREILEDDAKRKSENVVNGRGAAPVASATLHAALQLPRRLMFLVAGSEEPPLAVKTPRRASATMISKGRSACARSDEERRC